MNYSYEITGRILINPHRHNFRNTHKQNIAIVQFPKDDLDLYYQWFVKRRYGVSLQRPRYGTHITIASAFELTANVISPLQPHHKQIVTCKIIPGLQSFHMFWYIKAECAEVSNLRRKLGLTNKELHVTIGRTL